MVSYQLQLKGCYAAKDGKYTKSLFFALLDEFNFHIRGVAEYEFYPHGLTIVAILAESDARMHTWPERDIIDIDIFHCGDSDVFCIEELISSVKKLFHPRSVKYIVTDRSNMKLSCEGKSART